VGTGTENIGWELGLAKTKKIKAFASTISQRPMNAF
jgi:hypothetical protein